MLNIDVDIENVDIKIEDLENRIDEIATYIVKEERKNEYNKKDYYISILITNNESIKEINKEYRKKDTPTDVISFAYNETENIGEIEVIGDIIISYERVLEQAKDYNHSIEREFYYVLVHGLLHILGYDHIENEDRIKMREKEEFYLTKFNYTR